MFEPFSPFIGSTAEQELIESYRTNVRGIIDSYHGDYDFLIEPIQNAVDALEEKYASSEFEAMEKPKLEVVIDLKSGTVRVSDNGIGIDAEIARRICAPNFTTKPYYKESNRRSLRGHKGVGLTYLAFSTDLFRYYTKRGGAEPFSGELHNANSWAIDNQESISDPMVQPSKFSPEFLNGYESGSSFEMRVGQHELTRRGLSWFGWYTVINIMTAAGFCDINELHDWAKDATLQLTLFDQQGGRIEPPNGYSDINTLKYHFPNEILTACNLDEYLVKYSDVASIPPGEKGKYEAIFVRWDTDRIEEFFFNNGNEDPGSNRYQFYQFTRETLPSIYAMFTHSQRIWRERLDSGLSSDRRRRFWKPGVQIVTKQMPTGQMIEVTPTFRAGNKDRIFMLLELEDVKPDYGRKGFKSEVNQYVQFIAEQLINHFLKSRQLLKPTSVAHGPTATDAEAQALERAEQSADLPDLAVTSLSYKKVPQYENDVILLFGELVGRGIIKGIDILSASSGAQYDAVVNFPFSKGIAEFIYDANSNPLGLATDRIPKMDLPKRNLEFKHSLDDLIYDFEEETKQASLVRLAVAWDKGDLAETGFDIIDIVNGDMHNLRQFHSQTHILHYQENVQIPVILLKSVLDVAKGKGIIT